MHVWWEPTTAATTTVSATLEVLEPPTVDHLFFWALQATFVDASGSRSVRPTSACSGTPPTRATRP